MLVSTHISADILRKLFNRDNGTWNGKIVACDVRDNGKFMHMSLVQ